MAFFIICFRIYKKQINMSDQGFISIPPDSTGKSIRTANTLDLNILNENINNIPLIGDIILGGSSGQQGKLVGITRGDVEIIYHIEKDDLNQFTNGEDLIANTLVFGQAGDAGTRYHTQKMVLVDAHNPFDTLEIDNQGSAYVRFLEGNLQFDSIGRTEVSELLYTGEYSMTQFDNTALYSDVISNGGTIIHNPTASTLAISTNTSNGSVAKRTTNQYHPHLAGYATFVTMSVSMSDNGRLDNFRNFGYFDDNDGIMFRLSGTTFQAVLRSSVSGVITEQIINQSDFNGEKLDDPVSSEFVLDVSKNNSYWIDVAWIGRVRLGVYAPSGRRIILHSFNNGNQFITNYMKTASLPLCWESCNLSLTNGPSTIYVTYGMVGIDGNAIEIEGVSSTFFMPSEKLISGTTKVPLFSMRPRVNLSNGEINRITAIAQKQLAIVDGDPIIIDYVLNSTLTGSTFNTGVYTLRGTEIDIDATNMSGGVPILTSLASSGSEIIGIDETLGHNSNVLRLNADNSQNIITVSARCSAPNKSANVMVGLRVKEIK